MKNAEGVASDMRERSGNEEYAASVYDLSGRKIKGQENSKQLVNSSTRELVNSLKKGIYIVNGKKYTLSHDKP